MAAAAGDAVVVGIRVGACRPGSLELGVEQEQRPTLHGVYGVDSHRDPRQEPTGTSGPRRGALLGIYKDVRIIPVEGTIYQFDAIEAGQPFIVRDMDGELVMRDRGLLHTRFQVDTKGDDNPDNDESVDGSWELVADRGAHPGFYADYCQLAKDLLIP